MKYTAEQKRKLVLRYPNGESVSDICTQTDIARSTLYSWLKPYQTTITEAGMVVTPKEFVYLKKRVEKLEGIIQVLKSVDCTISAPLQDKLKSVGSTLWPVQYTYSLRCIRGSQRHLLQPYAPQQKNKSYQLRRTELSEQIRQIYDESDQIYGAKKISAVLKSRGVATSDKMVSELMQEMNLASIWTEAKRLYMRFHAQKKTDRLGKQFSASAPNQIWVSDATYFTYNKKMYYICAILDLYSRKVISYKISQKHSSQLITSTFRSAYEDRRPAEGLIFHSDRGTQYTAFAFQKLLKTLHVEQSFSSSGKPCYNAVMESFFSSLKREELYRRHYHLTEEFKECVRKYMDFYNMERPHSTLGYRALSTYETLYDDRKAAKEK